MLKLIRFKGFNNLEINIPNGIVLLDGRSGIGKTTILEAISFVLYDTCKIGCYPRGEEKKKKSTSVELTINGINIFRQRKSNLLKVKVDGKEYIDNEAQGYINSTFGSYELWKTGGYIKQGENCGFISMTNVDKLDFLQKLSSTFIFDALVDNTEKLISKTNNELKKLDIKIDTMENLFFEKKDNEITDDEWNIGLVEDLTNQSIEYNCKPTLKSLEKDGINNIKEEINSLNIRLIKDKELIKNNEGNIFALDELNKELISINNQISEYNKDELKSRLDILEDKLIKIRNSNKIKELIIKRNNLKNRISKLLNEDSKYSLSTLEKIKDAQNGDSIDKLQSIISNINSNIKYNNEYSIWDKENKIKQRINEMRKRVENYPTKSRSKELASYSLEGKEYTCPCCNEKLYLIDGKLTNINNGISKDELNRLKEEEKKYQDRLLTESKISDLQNNVSNIDKPSIEKKLKGDNKELEKIKLNIEILIDRINKLPDNYMSINVDNEIKKIKDSNLKRELEKELTYIVIDESEIINEEDEGKIKNEINSIKINLDNINKLTIRSELIKKEINRIKLIDVDEVKSRIDKNRGRINELEDRMGDLLDFIRVQKILTELDKLGNKIGKLNDEREIIHHKYSNYVKIKDIIIKAEYIIVDKILDKLNLVVEDTISNIFIEPISIVLKSMKKLKTKDRIKPEIHLDVNYKGSEFNAINTLSGGEKSRINLALTLAFSKLGNMPFLLLDECMSSLDYETKEKMIPCIRKYSDNKKVLIVNHDTTEGIYDDIIKLE